MISIGVKKERLVKGLFLFNLVAIGVALLAGIVTIFAFKDLAKPFILMMFSDFSQVMQFSISLNPYRVSAFSAAPSSYPPLAILILYPFALVCRDVIHLDSLSMIQTPQFWVSFSLFYALFFAAAALLLKRFVDFKGKSLTYFFLTLFLSGTVIYTVARGNIILAAFVLLLFFLGFYKSENKVLKELALISLAFSGALKIYPLFFGILLLKDKRFFPAARVAVYAVAMFFLPFLCFEGGFDNIKLFIANLGSFSLSNERLLYFINMSSSGLVHKLFYVFEKLFNVSLWTAARVTSVFLIGLLTATAITGVLFSKSKLSTSLICASLVAIVPPVSYYYSAVFLLIPLIDFINGYEGLERGRKRFYLVFFAAVACFVCFLFCSFLGLLFAGVVFYEAIKNIKIHYKEKQKIDRGGTI